MPWALGTDGGTAQNKTSGTTLSFTCPTVAVPAIVVVAYAFDNTSATTPTVIAPSNGGASWVKLSSFDSPVAGSGNGLRGELWAAPLSALNAGNMVFFSLDSPVIAKALVWQVYTGGENINILDTDSQITNSGSLTGSVGNLNIFMIGQESTSLVTDTSGTSLYERVQGIATSGGGAAANMSCTLHSAVLTNNTPTSWTYSTAADTGTCGASLDVPLTGPTGTAALSGSGTLAGIGTPSVQAASSGLSGTGTCAAIGVPAHTGSAVLTASGSLTAAPLVVYAGTTASSGSGTVTAIGRLDVSGTAACQATGSLAASGSVTGYAGVATSGSGDLLAASSRVHVSTLVALPGSGALGTFGAPALSGSVALSGSGILAALGLGSAALTGQGTLTAAAVGAVVVRSAVLSGTGTVTTSTSMTLSASPALSAEGALSAIGKMTITVQAASSGGSALTVTPGPLTVSGTGHVVSAGAIAAAALVATSGTAIVTGTGVLVTEGRPAAQVVAYVDGFGALSSVGVCEPTGTGRFAGEGALTTVGVKGANARDFSVAADVRTTWEGFARTAVRQADLKESGRRADVRRSGWDGDVATRWSASPRT